MSPLSFSRPAVQFVARLDDTSAWQIEKHYAVASGGALPARWLDRDQSGAMCRARRRLLQSPQMFADILSLIAPHAGSTRARMRGAGGQMRQADSDGAP